MGATPIGGDFNFVCSLFVNVVAPIVSVFVCCVLFYGMILSVLYSSAIILLRNRELEVCACCLVSVCVLFLLLNVSWVCMWYVIVTFPSYTHLYLAFGTTSANSVESVESDLWWSL